MCTCVHMYCIGRRSNAKRGGVVGRMRVDSGAVQCHVLTRVRVGVCVGSHPRPAVHMRKSEARRCKVCAPANGCMLVGVHGVQCETSTRARTVVARVQNN
jgi:hypothetical protein